MPARQESHTQGGSYRAVFHFICRDPADLTGAKAARLVARVLELECYGEKTHYQDFCAVVEGDPRKPFPKFNYILDGEAGWARVQDTDEVLRQKLADEAAHHREPGHVSYKPPVRLTRETCALIIGSRPFLFENARLYLEERGDLREKLLNLAQVICGLKSVGEDPRVDDYVQVNLWEKGFYPGNFDALAERVFRDRLSQAQMLERLGRTSPS